MRVFLMTAIAMLAFAGNSLLCRLALKDTAIDPAGFTGIRLASGALVLWLIAAVRTHSPWPSAGSWPSALALFGYAACFSFAYVGLSAGTGALLLFGAVQVSMLGWGLWKGERLRPAQQAGLVLAFGGLVALVLPGVSAPPPLGATLMIAAGVAWAVYSLRGRSGGDPTVVTAGNFLRSVPMAALLCLALSTRLRIDVPGATYAVASGALASGLGYAIWYTALKGLKATTAATVQLSVPVIAAAGGAALLGEHVTLRLLLTSGAVLSGIAMVVLWRRAT